MDLIQTFKSNWQKAKSLNDPNAECCSFATVSSDGQPAVRTLVLREVTEDSFIIFVSGTSPKWGELQCTERYELLMLWPTLMIQYRIRGSFTACLSE